MHCLEVGQDKLKGTCLFFADLPDAMGTIATFELFAVAFLVRPFGGMFFGPLADRIGRNRVLATTMILMALGTFAIGCIPGEASIGILAPILLTVALTVAVACSSTAAPSPSGPPTSPSASEPSPGGSERSLNSSSSS